MLATAFYDLQTFWTLRNFSITAMISTISLLGGMLPVILRKPEIVGSIGIMVLCIGGLSDFMRLSSPKQWSEFRKLHFTEWSVSHRLA